MTVDLISYNPAKPSTAKSNWKAITAISNEGIVFISDATVDAIAAYLDGVPMTNGQSVLAYAYPDPEDRMPSYIPSFGPGLLGEEDYRAVRTMLEEDEAGEAAVAMFDLIVELDLQIMLSGKDHCGARIKGVNWEADEVKINRTSTNMAHTMERLGLEFDKTAEVCEVDFKVFEKAVNDNAVHTDIAEHLEAFVACARRRNDTRVYWA